MSVRCVLERDDVADVGSAHSEHLFASVPAYADTVSIVLGGRPEVFFVTGVMHCAAGVIATEDGPVVHLSVSRDRPARRA